ncbi:uncharacterized protein LOC130649438 [Hydractinia symbiolongicarpus]|uniref:uncharacterized protein LOC130647765 n=1 Tax=Hydractinia symbiolongicarpus TaxID=13093 RepID=UPI00254EF79B|nr:uncharacterized protein LOC130647765 [Hydractinia symbiolongicarpus]XP_057311734.1 uncharacterized protein LOC130649438 [Hydractinia symbiolongicarpus]
MSISTTFVADTSPNFVFPSYIAVSQLRLDIVIFSNKLKRLVIIELTCPCEENTNYWHSTKVAKYSCLVNVILSSGWQVDFFAVEVGARGYCARTTMSCLKRLGFSNKMAYSTSKNLSKISMTTFSVWIARESRDSSQDSLIKAPGTRKTFPSNPAPVKEMPKGCFAGPRTAASKNQP